MLDTMNAAYNQADSALRRHNNTHAAKSRTAAEA
jgi:hypothetical protein